MWNQWLSLLVMLSIVVFFQRGVNWYLMVDVCFISPDRDHCRLGKMMAMTSLFTVYGLWRHLALFYLIAPSKMKLGFCIMVSLQVLLVNIVKIMKSGKFEKVCSTWEKTCVYVWFGQLRIMDSGWYFIEIYVGQRWSNVAMCSFWFCLNEKKKNERKQVFS